MNIILFEKDEPINVLSLEDRRGSHIKEVLGLRVGDTFDMGIVNGTRGKGKLLALSDRDMLITFLPSNNPVDETPLPLAPVTVMCGAIRPVGMKRILKDLTQLGVERIYVTDTDKGETSYLKSRLWTQGEYRQYLVEGAEQAFVTSIPEVILSSHLGETLDTWSGDMEAASLDRFALDNYEGSFSLGKAEVNQQGCVVAIGPERGWSSRERDLLRDAGFRICSLGKRVLKTETAAITAVSLLLSKIGRL